MTSSDVRRLWRIAFILALVIVGAKEHTRRLERAAERHVLDQLGGSGTVRVRIEPRWGALGVLLARAENIQVEASGFHTAQMPFFAEQPIPRWQGSARQVHIVFADFSVSGIPIRRFESRLFNVKLDSRAAAFALRVRLFGAERGPGWVELDEESMLAFIRRRLPEVHSPTVHISPSGVTIEGELVGLLVPWRFHASGIPRVVNSSSLSIDDVQVQMEGERLAPALVQKVLSALNPVLDVERDLRLGGAFVLERAELHSGFIRLIGRTTVPPRELGGARVDRRQ